MPTGNSRSNYVIGVDLGASKIYTGVFDRRFGIAGTARSSTKAQRGPAAVIERIVRSVHEALDECDVTMKQVKALGIGAPGTVDRVTGEVMVAPNLGWKRIPLQKALQKRLKIPVFVGNDCQVSMLGVHTHELKGKPRNALGIFIGTGIGGALVLNNTLYAGGDNAAGEIGHMVIQAGGPLCSCGNSGCFEAMASRNAVFRRILDAVREGEKTLLTEMLGKDLKDLRSGDLRKALRKGDRFVEEVVAEAAEYIGIGVGSLVNIFSPEVVVVGGGFVEALDDEIMPIIRGVARDQILGGRERRVEIISSTLADHAGIVGAAVLATRGLRRKGGR